MFIFFGQLFSVLGDKVAYLDPGSGSFIIQLLVAGLLGLGFIFRSSIAKVLNVFRRGKKNEDSEEGTASEDDEK